MKVKQFRKCFCVAGVDKNKYGLWYIKDGKPDSQFSSNVMIDGKNYTVRNGKIMI